MVDFRNVRRFEAVSFRSFPATTSYFDGTWAVRLTPGHPAKRLNSVNPLDPQDDDRIEERIRLLGSRFAYENRSLIFRLSPLAPDALRDALDQRDWTLREESIVMTCDLSQLELEDALDHVPLRDTLRWLSSLVSLGEMAEETKSGMEAVLAPIADRTDLFLQETRDGKPICAVRCVRDQDVVGLFELVTLEDERGKGHALKLVTSALKWAKKTGIRTAWLQVVADNHPAIALYEKLGFKEIYRYHYRIAEDQS